MESCDLEDKVPDFVLYSINVIAFVVWGIGVAAVHFFKRFKDANDAVTIHHKIHKLNAEKQRKEFEQGRQTNFLKGTPDVEAQKSSAPAPRTPGGSSRQLAPLPDAPSFHQSLQASFISMSLPPQGSQQLSVIVS
ncbi:unnamed protein product, partial [Mesorhabditis spiculigera]